MLLQPRADYYASRLPNPPDIMLVVEIARISLGYDRDTKARIYAESGIREYWLADLTANRVSCYSAPQSGSYLTTPHHQPGESMTPLALPDCVVLVERVLLAVGVRACRRRGHDRRARDVTGAVHQPCGSNRGADGDRGEGVRPSVRSAQPGGLRPSSWRSLMRDAYSASDMAQRV